MEWPYTLPEWDGQDNVRCVIPGIISGVKWIVVRMTVRATTSSMAAQLSVSSPRMTIRVVNGEVVRDVEYTDELSQALREYATSKGLRFGSQTTSAVPSIEQIGYRLPEP